jgi:hypothetical protein
MPSAAERAMLEVLESDLRALSAEARRTDGNLATQITGWLQHTDYAQIKESAERAVLKLRAVAQDGGGLAAVREAKVRASGAVRALPAGTTLGFTVSARAIVYLRRMRARQQLPHAHWKWNAGGEQRLLFVHRH